VSIQNLDVAGVRCICLSYLESKNGAHAHYLMRRLRRRIPDAHAIAGFWGLSDHNGRFLDAFGATEAEVVANFQDTLASIIEAIDGPDAASPAPPAKDKDEAHWSEAAA
jgi:hypothetical protein